METETKNIGVLQNNESVLKFMQMMQDAKMEVSFKDFSELINYIDKMEQQLDKVSGELQEMKTNVNISRGAYEDLSQPQQRDTDVVYQESHLNLVENLEKKIAAAKEQLVQLKNDIIETAQNAINNIKEKGISGMNQVTDFLKVKEGLIAIRDSVDSTIEATDKAIQRIEAASSEIRAVGGHTKNIVKAIRGKELTQDFNEKEKGTVEKIVEKPFQVTQNTLSEIKGTLDAAIGKTSQLENTAKDIDEKAARKAFVKDNLRCLSKGPALERGI